RIRVDPASRDARSAVRPAGPQEQPGDHLRGSGQAAESEKLFRAAAQIGEELAVSRPRVLNYQTTLGGVYYNLAGLLRETMQHDAAEQAYETSIALYGRLIAEFPAQPEMHLYRAWHLVAAAELRRERGRAEAARENANEAAAAARRAISGKPSNDVLRDAAWF